ncbi:sterol desaturase family protein [Candidatus Litorirhabdus singularis]|nr:sterol desaturase family protein [Candidatus Litorirhabdus singularis]
MAALWADYLAKIPQVYVVLGYAYMSLVLSWPLFLLLEKITPVVPRTPLANFWLNWRITASNLVLSPLISSMVIVATAALALGLDLPRLNLNTSGLGVGLPLLDTLMQGTVIFFTACLLGDFSYYWWHRAQHQIPFLWEMHKLHHSDENLNTTTIYRSHFTESAGQALFRGLSVGLVFDPAQAPQTVLAIVAGGLLLVLWDYFIHANVRIDALHRFLPFFSTPQYHWVHHSKLPQHQDKNFAIWLPLYDVLFGSYYKPTVDEYPPTGLASGEKIETVWAAQSGPLVAWCAMLARPLRRLKAVEQGSAKAPAESEP